MGAANSETLMLKADKEHPYFESFIEEQGAPVKSFTGYTTTQQEWQWILFGVDYKDLWIRREIWME